MTQATTIKNAGGIIFVTPLSSNLSMLKQPDSTCIESHARNSKWGFDVGAFDLVVGRLSDLAAA